MSSVNQSSGCFNGILRRLLCSGSVPTHPSDQIAETNTNQLTKSPNDPNFEPKMQSSASVTPGIVARLMGLDSLPETNWVLKGRAPDLVKRSRSVSFADYLMDFDGLNDHQQQHRRVRTSVSFREVPAVLNHQKSPDFLVLYLDNVDESKEFGSKVKKSEVGFGEMKQGKKKEQRSKNKEKKNRESDDELMKKKKKEEKIVVLKQNKKISKLKDEPRRECGAQSSKSKGLNYSVSPSKKTGYKNGGANLKENCDHHQLKKTTQKKKVVVEPRIKKRNGQHEAKEKVVADSHGSENTSPVSVLDIDDILIQHETWLSEYSIPMDFNSKMIKSSPKASYNGNPEVRAAKGRDFEPIKDEESRDYAELLASKIQKWTEDDLKESNWVVKNVAEFEGFEEICMEFEGLILDGLLRQAIDEFLQISYENLWSFSLSNFEMLCI